MTEICRDWAENAQTHPLRHLQTECTEILCVLFRHHWNTIQCPQQYTRIRIPSYTMHSFLPVPHSP